MPTPSRREFLAVCAVTLGGALVPVSRAAAAVPRARPAYRPPARPHPTPRPGITGERVLTRAQLADAPDLVPLFDAVRAAPAVLDGIRCNCGCADQPGYYSLLSCYEGDAMAKGCPICQGQGRVATRLHRAGKSLDEIRVAVDAQFG